LGPAAIALQYWRGLRGLSRDAHLFLVATAVFGLAVNGYFVIYNLYLLELGLGPGSIGAITAGSVLGLTVAGIPGGYFAERAKPRSVMMAALAAIVVTMSLRAILTDGRALVAAAFLDGMNQSFFWIAGLTLMGSISSVQDRSVLFSLNGLIGSLIGIPGNLLAGSLPHVYQQVVRTTLLQAERLTLLSMLLFILPALFLYSRLKSSGAAPQPGFGNIFFKQRYGFQPEQVGYVFATNQVLVVIVFLLLPALAMRWKKAHLLATFRLAALPLVAGLALGMPAWLAWPSFAMGQAAFRTTLVVGDNLVVDIVPAPLRARAAGLRWMTLSLGAVVANAAGGWLIQNRGYQLPIWGSVILGALLALSLVVFYGRREAQPGQGAAQVAAEGA
jgi:MFS family permease